ncbi:ATP-binding cassette domain-containing protein [Arthrobacter sp. NA-172]|uniref:ATP-binding cassette domain-containing protein n=1 Tax=Arthrobacter sp. NA-172 TaxID=3367524 RepID=UPI0037552ADE
MTTDLLVKARAVTKSFGVTKALISADLTLRRGEVHALLGGNGAGKSTLISILTKATPADGGTLEFATEKVAVVHQELAILPELTVSENINLGRQGGPVFPWKQSAAETERVLALLGLTHSDIRPGTIAGTLQLHQLQMVEIARALSSGADLILLDEPTASLTVDETDKLFTVLRTLREQGIGLVLVSHRMHEIRQIADVATVLRDGRTVVDRRPLAEIDDAEIVREMFGATLLSDAEAERPLAPQSQSNGEASISIHHRASGITVDLKAGTVVGLAGTPQGPASLFNALLGASKQQEWEVTVGAKVWNPSSPRRAIRQGVGYISGDRADKGVFPDLSIRDNAVLARQVVKKTMLRRPSEEDAVRKQADILGFGHVDVEALPQSLSGGTLQKVLIARWLGLPLTILLLEEPTRGVDVKTKSDLYALIRTMAESGVIVLWWSTENRELLAISQQILAFTVNGEPHRLLETPETDETQLLRQTGTT